VNRISSELRKVARRLRAMKLFGDNVRIKDIKKVINVCASIANSIQAIRKRFTKHRKHEGIVKLRENANLLLDMVDWMDENQMFTPNQISTFFGVAAGSKRLMYDLGWRSRKNRKLYKLLKSVVKDIDDMLRGLAALLEDMFEEQEGSKERKRKTASRVARVLSAIHQ